MLNPNRIDPRHLPSMQAALLKHHSTLIEHQVEKLYGVAVKLLEGVKSPNDPKVLVSSYKAANESLTVTVTDVDTGLFVQLTDDKTTLKRLMTFGQKFCQETHDAMRGNVATKIW